MEATRIKWASDRTMESTEFEWLYIDVHQPDGYDLVFSFHSKPFMSHFEVSILDVFVYHRNRLKFHKFLVVPPDTLKIEHQGDAIQSILQSEIRFKRNPKGLDFTVKSETLEVKLSMTSEMQATNFVDIHFPTEGSPLQSFRWVLYLPLAKATGHLRFKEKKGSWQEISMSGRGYCDGNKGKFNLKKELKSWLWLKIYDAENLWIAGKILPCKEEQKNFVVKVQPNKIEHTFSADIVLDEKSLLLRSRLGEASFMLDEHYQLDDLRFLVPVWPKILQPLEKLREIFAAVTLDRSMLRPLRNVLTNGKYTRHRYLGRNANGQMVEIFGEEMDLND